MPQSDDVLISYDVDDDIPAKVVTDGSWIMLILINFVSNAFKQCVIR